MISTCGSSVAHLGGWRGDRLFHARDAGELRPLLDLGWDEALQFSPMRRLLLTDQACFVLEAVEGGFLKPPLRVRTFDLEGNEVAREEGADPVEDPTAVEWQFFLAADARVDGRKTGDIGIRHAGIDIATGRPLAWQGTAKMPDRNLGWWDAGTPARQGAVWYYPMRGRGLLRVGPEGGRFLPGHASMRLHIGGALCSAGIRDGESGILVDETWRPLPGPAPFVSGAVPVAPLVAPHGEGGLALLRRWGGDLGVLDAPAARLPPGVYEALLALPEGLFGLAVGDSPALVRAAF